METSGSADEGTDRGILLVKTKLAVHKYIAKQADQPNHSPVRMFALGD